MVTGATNVARGTTPVWSRAPDVTVEDGVGLLSEPTGSNRARGMRAPGLTCSWMRRGASSAAPDVTEEDGGGLLLGSPDPCRLSGLGWTPPLTLSIRLGVWNAAPDGKLVPWKSRLLTV